MYKLVTVVAILMGCWFVPGSFGIETKPCSPTVTKTINWKDKGVDTCLSQILAHVKKEFDAALSYTALSAHFQQENHFRPAVAKFFLDSAAEERGHAKKLLDYVRMRGGQFGASTTTVTPENEVDITAWNFAGYKKLNLDDHEQWQQMKNKSGDTKKLGCENTLTVMCALNVALDLETQVTEAIRQLIQTCEKGPSEYNDYHSVDYLTGEFLTEQHEGTRQLAGMIANLQQISFAMEEFPALAEIVFDQSLA